MYIASILILVSTPVRRIRTLGTGIPLRCNGRGQSSQLAMTKTFTTGAYHYNNSVTFSFVFFSLWHNKWYRNHGAAPAGGTVIFWTADADDNRWTSFDESWTNPQWNDGWGQRLDGLLTHAAIGSCLDVVGWESCRKFGRRKESYVGAERKGWSASSRPLVESIRFSESTQL